MKLTRKNLKITKKTLFSFKKQSAGKNLNWTADPTGTFGATPNTSMF